MTARTVSLLACVLCAVFAAAQTAPVAPQATRAASLPLAELKTQAMVYDLLATHSQKPPEVILHGAVRGMVQAVDPDDGAFYDREAFNNLRQTRSSAGVGIDLFLQHGLLVVRAVALNSPGGLAGVQPGDIVLALDGGPAYPAQLRDAIVGLKGADGSKLALTLLRPGQAAPMSVTMTRVLEPEVQTRTHRPHPRVLLLQPTRFSEHALRDTATKLGDEWRRQPFDALILDLRGNTGGLVTTAIGLCAMFLPNDAIVMTLVGVNGATREPHKATARRYAGSSEDPLANVPSALRRMPLSVLIDESTAAGAEIVAAALQDHQRAKLIGQRSFGRGSVQTIVPIGDEGAVKFTTHHWERPSGSHIHKMGVVPDVPAADAEAGVAIALKSFASVLK